MPMTFEPFTDRELAKYRSDLAEWQAAGSPDLGAFSESTGTMMREAARWLATVAALAASPQQDVDTRWLKLCPFCGYGSPRVERADDFEKQKLAFENGGEIPYALSNWETKIAKHFWDARSPTAADAQYGDDPCGGRPLCRSQREGLTPLR